MQTDYEVAPGNTLTTFRAFIDVEVGGRGWITPVCFFDTGAPFTIISQSVARAITPLPIRNAPVPIVEAGMPAAPMPARQFRAWFDPVARRDVPCLFAEVTVQFRNRVTGDCSDPRRVVAKVLQAPALPFGGRFVLFGMHLLTENTGRLHLDAQPWNLAGPGLFFAP